MPHSTTTNRWINLASGGAYSLDLCGWIKTSGKDEYNRRSLVGGGVWTANGYAFDGMECFAYAGGADGAFVIPAEYTLQLAMAASTADLSNEAGTTAYLFRPGKAWSCNSVCMRQTANGSVTPEDAVYAVDETRFKNTTTRPCFSNPSPRYATVLADAAALRVFEGTEIPAASTGGDSWKAGARSASDTNSWFAIGAQYDGSPRTRANLQGLSGTLHALRFYGRALSAEEVAWNRVVDEARYFGRRAAIPVTNVVVSCGIDGVADGHFALDAEGHTFTAPASRTVKGRRYVLGGYTLETWNGSSWGDAAAHPGERSCAVSGVSGKVRLTWLYARPEGEGRLVVYDVEDYVQDGLAWHYDGIRNVGADAEHSQSASIWANLGTAGSSRDLAPSKWLDGDQGAWEEDGYVFKGNSVFCVLGSAYSVPATYTVQTLVDAGVAGGQKHPYPHVYSAAYTKFALALSVGDNFLYSNTQGTDRDGSPRFRRSSRRYDYATVVLDGDARTQAVFDGTVAPTSGDYKNGFRTFDDAVSPYDFTAFRVGGYGGSDQSLVGKVKSLRFYPGKILTSDELAQNRKVDEWRFFHRPPATNVVVATTRAFLHGCESEGPWQVEGSYTFTAPEGATDRNVAYACDGYTLETWDGGAWGEPVAHQGTSCAYAAADGLVRLTWRWRAVRGIRSAADYDVQDYVANGLAVNYDGIRNAGASAPHDPAAVTWANLCSGGSAYELARHSLAGSSWKAGGASGSWSDCGFEFGMDSAFHEWSPFVVPPRFTVQTLVDAAAGDQAGSLGIGYVLNGYDASNWSDFSIAMRNSEWNTITDPMFYLCCVGQTGGRPTIRAGSAAERFSYATAMLDKTNAVMFADAEAPWTASSELNGGMAGHAVSTTARPAAYTNANGICIGGPYPRTDQLFSGTVKSFRFYDRVLSDAEVAWNREVDEARFFGRIDEPDVVVADGGGAQAEAGEYRVHGSWVFTATSVTNGHGRVVPATRHMVETMSGGVWTNRRTYEGCAYAHTVGESPASVRLTWKGPPDRTLMIFR